MKKFFSVFLICLLIIGSLPLTAFGAQGKTSKGKPTANDYQPGEVIVCMTAEQAKSRQSGLLANAKVLMELPASTESQGTSTRSLSKSSAGTSQVLALVTDKNRSTEDLIEELSDDPRVIFAEPNYKITPFTDEPAMLFTKDGNITTADTKNSSDTLSRDTSSSLPDMTDYQWAYNNTGEYFGSQKGFDMNIPGWNQPSGENKDIVIAVLDTGVDDTNPDLKNKMWNRGNLDLPGGEHGISFADWNALEDTSDPDGHGTHCAGIIGAQWGNGGTSGASEHAKIMALRFGSDLESIILCYAYMEEAINQGVNLKAVNCSFTTAGTSQSLNLAVEILGKLGAVSVYGSANSAADNDKTHILSSTFVSNPYAVVVNASNSYGKLASYSCYGIRTTDIVAPGTQILSTGPEFQSSYYPEFTNDNLFYEGFENGDGSLAFYTTSAPKNGKRCGEIVSEKPYNGTYSLKLKGSKELTTIYSEPMDLTALDGFNPDAEYRFSLSAAGGGDQGSAGLSISVKLTNGEFTSLSGPVSMDGGFESNTQAEQILPENTDYKHFQFRLDYAPVTLDFSDGFAKAELTDGYIYIDNIGIGEGVLPFFYSNGTSMATPAITGAIAVLAERYPNDSPAKRAARVIGSAAKNEEFKDICVSDGAVDLSKSANPNPVVNSADIKEDSVVIDGYFFGNQPQVTIDGKNVTIYSSESTPEGGSRLTVSKPQGLSGLCRVSVTSASGEGHQAFDFGQAADASYFEHTLPLPEDTSFYDAENYQIVPYGEYLYFFPTLSLTYNPVDQIWRFHPDTQTWDQIKLPESLMFYSSSAAVWQDTLYIHDLIYMGIFTYNGSSWDMLPDPDAKFPITGGSLVNASDSLLLMGGLSSDSSTNSWQHNHTIYSVDPKTASLKAVGTSSRDAKFPYISANDETLLVTGGLSQSNQNGMLPGAELLTLQNGTYVEKKLDLDSITERSISGFASAPVKGGYLMIGSESKDGTTDTYFVSKDGSISLYDKRVSNLALSSPSAAAYNGQVYVLAHTNTGDHSYIFKSTSAQTLDMELNPNPETPVEPEDPEKPEQPGDTQDPGQNNDPETPGDTQKPQNPDQSDTNSDQTISDRETLADANVKTGVSDSRNILFSVLGLSGAGILTVVLLQKRRTYRR
ncbi:Cell wall-associated protease precursor [uncultured Roseburia sp.]|uniref:S8 family serine peptidase n=1 Tax=Brotonthovivens ammoniilytica TaxID=2981725 RepID=A0ABT2TKJ7_9FIRM|nr:S8 family serine peptidase [Brotonthovivens ammoniilytica]MCU6762740.1 S8 family serine peptidase [Brotonthovivens ammoniilytica]SCI86733.1 Cell wall-associated protease precursor [uncultured Roseburia sp.]